MAFPHFEKLVWKKIPCANSDPVDEKEALTPVGLLETLGAQGLREVELKYPKLHG